jgi:hypothetical protein
LPTLQQAAHQPFDSDALKPLSSVRLDSAAEKVRKARSMAWKSVSSCDPAVRLPGTQVSLVAVVAEPVVPEAIVSEAVVVTEPVVVPEAVVIPEPVVVPKPVIVAEPIVVPESIVVAKTVVVIIVVVAVPVVVSIPVPRSAGGNGLDRAGRAGINAGDRGPGGSDRGGDGQANQHKQECILDQILCLLLFPQACHELFHIDIPSSRVRELALGYEDNDARKPPLAGKPSTSLESAVAATL